MGDSQKILGIVNESICVHHCNGKVQQLQQRLYGPQNLKYLPTGPLQEKSADHWHIDVNRKSQSALQVIRMNIVCEMFVSVIRV